MKQFYSIILTLALSAAAGTATGTERKASCATLPLPSQIINAEPAGTLRAVAQTPVPKAAEEESEWVSLGQATYTDGFLTDFYDMNVPTWSVEIMESTTTPGYYRLIKPYAHLSSTGDCSDLYIHAERPRKVYISTHDMKMDLGNGNVKLGSMAGYFKESGVDDMTIDDYEYFGTFDGHVITFGEQTLWVTQENYNKGQRYYANRDGRFRITLPSDKETCSVRIIADDCAPDMTYQFSTEATGEFSALKYLCVRGTYNESQSLYDQIADLSESEVEAGLKYTVDIATPVVSTLFVVAVDADNNVLAGAMKVFFPLNDDNDSWTSLGETTYTEDIMASVFSYHEVEQYNVELQRHNTREGVYRLVNPYTTANWSMYDPLSICIGHNHYIVIDASDPDQVVIEETPVGLNYGQGQMYVISTAKFYIDYHGYDPDSDVISAFYGTLQNNRITFPANGILLGELQNDEMAIANSSASFAVEIPDPAGIGAVTGTAGNASAPVYYNLQGQKVTAPEAGSLYIVVRGTEVTKEMFR